MSFATGFFNSSKNFLDTQAAYITNKRAKDRDFLMTYGVQAVTGAKTKVNNIVNIGMELENMGLKAENINYIVETSGPAGLESLYSRVKGMTPSQLSASEFNKMVEKADDYKSSGQTYQQNIERTFGLYKNAATDDPAENEKASFWSSFGFDPNASDRALDEMYIDGYSGRDIKRIMGTAPSGMQAPLSVDFSRLPTQYSETAYIRMAQYSNTQSLAKAQTVLDGIAKTGDQIAELQRKGGKPLADYNTLQAAIKAEKYDVIRSMIPSIGNDMLEYDASTNGGLSKNPHFNYQPGVKQFFFDERQKREGGPEFMQASYSSLLTRYPEAIPLKAFKSYDTLADAKASGDSFFILKGAPTVSDFYKNNRDPENPNPSLRPTGQQPVSTPEVIMQTLDEDGRVEKPLSSQMLDLDIADKVEDNPILSGWTRLGDNAVKAFDDNYNAEFQKREASNTMNPDGSFEEAYDVAGTSLNDMLETVNNYLVADATGASDAKRKELADKIAVDIEAAPEQVQTIMMDLIDKLENSEFPAASPEISAGPKSMQDQRDNNKETGDRIISNITGWVKDAFAGRDDSNDFLVHIPALAKLNSAGVPPAQKQYLQVDAETIELLKRVAPELLVNDGAFVEKFNSPEQTAANLQPHQIQDTSLNRNKRQLMDKLRELGYEVD